MSKKKRDRFDDDFLPPSEPFSPWKGDSIPFAEVLRNTDTMVDLVDAKSLTDYVVRLLSHKRSFSELEVEMNKFYRTASKVSQSQVGLQDGIFCIFYDVHNETAHRVYVEMVCQLPADMALNPSTYNDPNVADIYLVDHATSMRVRQRDLYQMDERFAEEPISTFKVRLDGLKDTQKTVNGHARESETYWFKLRSSPNCKMVVHSNFVHEDEDVFMVDLFIGGPQQWTDAKSILPQANAMSATADPATSHSTA
ncbi:hypothetical protein AAVH_01388 [Aphelenchoides avenae]|nr:hypothetical protein AAVH_01388 [Aphelenchus avenae]